MHGRCARLLPANSLRRAPPAMADHMHAVAGHSLWEGQAWLHQPQLRLALQGGMEAPRWRWQQMRRQGQYACLVAAGAGGEPCLG